MAKELPYFKFEPNQWDSGMIQLCSLQAKGLFIEICCLYWSRVGDLPYALALQKLCNGDSSLLQELEKNQIYDVENENIVINFLDELSQLLPPRHQDLRVTGKDMLLQMNLKALPHQLPPQHYLHFLM